MKGRSGQVALYLVTAIVAVCILVVMNVGVYVAVTAKNRAMNAGDACALAVARHQGELLNRIGQDNLDHLRAVLDRSKDPDLTDKEREERLEAAKKVCQGIMERQRRACFLGPLEGLRIGNDMAQKYDGLMRNLEARNVLQEHVSDILNGYAADPEQYPEPWEGAWGEYAAELQAQIPFATYACPDSIDFLDAADGHPLLNAQFYNAIAGRNWCWFHFNAPGLLENFSGWPPLPSPDDETRRRRCCNSEIYSLHLMTRTGSALTLFGEELICRLTGYSSDDVRLSVLVHDETQVWFYYDEDELWRNWWEMDPDGEWQMPVVGKVKREYDVRGCAACCRVCRTIPDALRLFESHVAVDADMEGWDRTDVPEYVPDKLRNVGEDDGDGRFFGRGARTIYWTAAAKPFGTATNADGDIDVVTAVGGLVLPSFSDVRLVPWDSVGGRDESRPDLDMVGHVRHHLHAYLERGAVALDSGCYYCRQLRVWEDASLRRSGAEWLRNNSRSCRRTVVGGSGRGGTPHGH